MRRRVRSVLIVVLATVLAVVAATRVVPRVLDFVYDRDTIGSFYELPDPLPPGEPGDIIRKERLLGAPVGSIAWRVLYRSTDLNGDPIGVSGVIVTPIGPAPDGGRPVVSWAHPTTGAYGSCAPSESFDPFELMAGLHELIGAGHVIAATDYSGMGADGPPSYLIGETEGHNVLDIARAARLIAETDAGDALTLWGHSQGGQAALFAAQLAPSYAPEFDLRGVAVAAPAAELGDLLRDHRDDVSGVTIGSLALDAFHRVYGATDPEVTLDSVLTPEGEAVVPKITPMCLLKQMKEVHAIAAPVVGNYFSADPSTVEPWATLLAENTPDGSPIVVPILVTQGTADELVIPATTAGFVDRLCAAHEQVEFRTYDGIDHGLIGELTVPYLISWMSTVRDGGTPPTTCDG
jgi:pimeloyl-ACP methyl ester carboxylesterase